MLQYFDAPGNIGYANLYVLPHSVFEQWVSPRACEDIVNLAEAAQADPDKIAERPLQILTDNAYCKMDDLIPLPEVGAR